MTKQEIIRRISEETGCTQTLAKEIVQRTLDSIVDALVDKGKIELRNFGCFEVKHRKAQKGRNPKTGEPIDIPARNVVSFKAGKEMARRVNMTEAEKRFGESGFMPHAKARLQAQNEKSQPDSE